MAQSQTVKFAKGRGEEFSLKIKPHKTYITEFTWILSDWYVNGHQKYPIPMMSDAFQLHGIDGCTCRMTIGNRVYSFLRFLDIELSNSENILAMVAVMHVNGRKLNYSGTHRIPKCINSLDHFHGSGLDEVLQQCYDSVTLSLIIVVKFTITKFPEYNNSCQNSATNVVGSMEAMLEDKPFSDVIFVVGKKELTAHKAVLAVKSEVFRRMFESAMKERETSRVEIDDIEEEVFEEFIKYLYIEEMENLKNMAGKMYFVADKYQVADLKEVCEDYMLENLHNENVVEYFFLADKFSCTKLKEKAHAILQNNVIPWIREIKNENFEYVMHLKELFLNDSQKESVETAN